LPIARGASTISPERALNVGRDPTRLLSGWHASHDEW
jgi:hypothetical protein